ncbi:MAG: aminodeoxychorismate/anthranilate synthase component II [Vicingaceae bacterium]
MPNILLIDNYDSFTYNLFHYLEELSDDEVEVIRNDELELDQIDEYQAIVISPGPGLPSSSGKLMEFLERFAHKKKILGICLGQQAIAEHFGMRLKNLNQVVHGQAKRVRVISGKDVLFKKLPATFNVGRYHSWVIEPSSLSPDFEVTSFDDDNNIMSIAHKSLPLMAVQFHPESVLTEYGKEMMKNWLESKPTTQT